MKIQSVGQKGSSFLTEYFKISGYS